ncbi:MAG: hypothetical protein B6A08_06035 [Sorangiineae bacterium NIC37A_2]|jgi:hypothetical protein|nr:MAG: hypothetical protein B6A08_06035 [Sorangiineae bacterium NIC37A_2]
MKSALFRIALAALLLVAPSVALGTETVVVSGSRVRLVDILPNAPAGISNTDLGPAPPPGRSRYLDPEEIASRLRAQGVAASRLELPRGVRVESAGHLFTPEELTRLVASPLAAALPEGITLVEHSVASAHLLSPTVSVGAVHLPDLGRKQEIVTQTATVELVAGGAPVLRLPVRIKVRVSDSVRASFVERGSSVTLSIVRGRVEVSGVGETLRSAKVGELVTVRVLATNKVVTAELVAPDRARLEMKQ